MIYGRFGNKLAIKRLAVLADVERLDDRKPDQVDRHAIENGSYLVCIDEDGRERLYHQAFMRADGGAAEIARAVEALPGQPTPSSKEGAP